MDIEASRRKEILAHLTESFDCIEECRISLLGFEERLRADVVAISKSETDPWILAFEVKEPNDKWELKNWLKALRQAGEYPNCKVTDGRAGAAYGKVINASFLYPGPELSPWGSQDSQGGRFYRDYDIKPLSGAILLAQHFKVGTAKRDTKTGKFTLRLGTDPIWDRNEGFRKKSSNLLSKRRVGSLKKTVSIESRENQN
ncbi:hypothetical protein V5F38_01060 [Xanthobacter sp. V0B-10]|uniref:hypothetical protein n=1 Tax=Xanthobacter albus TaxID=3119929 RepID=UPI003728680C